MVEVSVVGAERELCVVHGVCMPACLTGKFSKNPDDFYDSLLYCFKIVDLFLGKVEGVLYSVEGIYCLCSVPKHLRGA